MGESGLELGVARMPAKMISIEFVQEIELIAASLRGHIGGSREMGHGRARCAERRALIHRR